MTRAPHRVVVLVLLELALACTAPRVFAQSTTYRESDVECLCPMESETWAIGVAGGPTWLDSQMGAYGRLTLTPTFAVASPHQPFPARLELSVNGWKNTQREKRDYGLAGPTLQFLIGYEHGAPFALIGPTFDLLSWQSIDDRQQLGFLAPGVRSVLGFVLHSFRVGVEAALVYHWHVGAPDRFQVTLGLSLALVFWEEPDCDRSVSCTPE